MNHLFRAFLLASLFLPHISHAIPEMNYQTTFTQKVFPFLKTGDVFQFQSFDGKSLSAIRFLQPATTTKGVIVVIPGRSETFLKYAEVFFDLYQKGYSIYSLDLRGQGTSFHYCEKNSQIGDIENFSDYENDFVFFMNEIVLKQTVKQKHFLLAHSLGGAIAAHYLSEHTQIFDKAILSAPMLQINTHPYPEPLAYQLASILTQIGNGGSYAPGRGDYDPSLTLDESDVTHSAERFWMSKEINHLYPVTLIGGPSNRWVKEAIHATHKIRKEMEAITTPTLLFQAWADEIVKLKGQTQACDRTSHCTLIPFPNSGHEILMEKDSIRDKAFRQIFDFF